jgi:hypothetical protein
VLIVRRKEVIAAIALDLERTHHGSDPESGREATSTSTLLLEMLNDHNIT